MACRVLLAGLLVCLFTPSLVCWQGNRAADGATASGVVVDGVTGKPIEGASVSVSAADVVLSSTVTSADGGFTLTDIPIGRHLLGSGKDGYVQQWPEADPPFFDFSAGSRITGVRLALFGLPQLSGRLLDRNGAPLRDVEVRVVHNDWRSGRRELSGAERASTDQNGEFHFTDLVPERCAVFVSGVIDRRAEPSAASSPLSIVSGYYPGRVDVEEASLPALRWGEHRQLPDWFVDMTPAASVSGHLQGFRGRDLVVELWSDEFPRVEILSSEVKPDGSFRISAAPGRYHLRVSAEAKTGSHVTVAFSDRPVDLAPGDDQRIDLPVHYAGDVTGVVLVAGSGKPSNISLDLWPYPNFAGTFRKAMVDASGHFTFEAVPPGKYFVQAAADAPWHFVGAELNGETVTDQPLTVGAAGASGLEATFNQTVSSLSGRVSDIPGAELYVTVFPVDRASWTDFPSPSGEAGAGRRFQQQPLGLSRSYSFPDLPAGTYAVVAHTRLAQDEIVDIDDWAAPPNLERLAAIATTVIVQGHTAAPLIKSADFRHKVPQPPDR